MTDQNEDEITLLDLLVFLAEHWIAILLMPLILAVAAYFASGLIERDYTATAVIDMPATDNRESTSPLSVMADHITQRANRSESDERLTAAAQGNEITLSATASTEDGAKAIIRNAITGISEVATQSIEESEQRISRVGEYVERLENVLSSDESEGITTQALATAATLRAQHDLDMQEVGIAKDWVASAQAAEINVNVNGQHQSFYAALALLAAGFVALSACVLRARWLGAKQNPSTREKINRIRSAFGLSSRW